MATAPIIHLCHAIGCYERIPTHRLMCSKHWYMVPQLLRTAVWRTYRPGQERDKEPSALYIVAARNAINSVAVQQGKEPLGVETPIGKPIPQKG